MRFEHRNILWFLLLVLPGLIAFLWWSWNKRRQLIGQFVQSRLLAQLTVGISAQRQKLRLALLVASAGLLLIVLARPQWGFTWEEVHQRGLDIIVAIDTSRSMLAEDVPPNRLNRAKLAALDLKKLAKTDRVGLVAFAGSAFLQCPLSFDDEAFRQSVNALDVNIIPQGGTALAEAIETARAAFKEKNDNHKVLILFTDGEDHDGSAVEAAKTAAREGMMIFTIGVGSPNGELLRVADSKGRVDFIKDDQGNVVKSRLNEKLLRDIAESAEGYYMMLSGASTMEVLYERRLAPLPKAEHAGRQVQKFHERYQWFLGLAILLLIVEMFIPERKPVRKNEAMMNAPNPELRKAMALLFVLALPAFSFASPSDALKQYQKGRYEAAYREYQRALKNKPADPRLHYNAGSAAYQAKNYDKALEHLNSALLTPDLQLQERAYYNLGNTEYRLGEEASDPAKKQEAWQDSIQRYDSALKLNPQDTEARENMEVVKKKLEELKKQQQQQQNKDENKDQKDKDKDKQDQQNKKDQQDQKDQNSKDKNEQQKQDQEKQKQEQQKKDQEEKDKQDQQQQDAKKQDDSKKDDKKEAKKGEENKGEPGSKDDKGEQGNRAMVMRMTPQEAAQLLDTQKGEEKALMFIPENAKPKNRPADRVFKDW
jgi:Ca-activated chloride channel family protein